MRRLTALVGALLLLMASCGDDDVLQSSTITASTVAPGTAAETTVAPTTVATTAAPTTAAPTTAAPTTVAPTTVAPTTVAPPLLYPVGFDGPGSPAFPPVLGAAGDPNGSGCVPGGDVLPDGIWFGYAEGVSEGIITFDLACYFTGAAALAVSGPDCDTEFGDYCVRNVNPKTFTVPIAGTADVFYIDGTTWDLVPVAPSAWPVVGSYLTCPGEKCGVWLYINSGAATGIVEMFEE